MVEAEKGAETVSRDLEGVSGGSGGHFAHFDHFTGRGGGAQSFACLLF